MNKITLSFFVLFMALMVVPAAFARDLVVAVSPYYSPDEAKKHSIQLLQQLTQLGQGNRATLIDGYGLSIIGEFNMDNPAYNNPKARLGLNRDVVAALKRFADKSVMPGSEGHPAIAGAVRLPQLLRYAAEHFSDGKQLDVIVLGSPFFDDPKEPAFSMTGGRFPSDGHLFVTPGKSPFGTEGQGQLLKNVHVHIGYGSDGIMQGDRHRYFVQRFWTLYVERLGGKLSSFIADVPTVFRGLAQKNSPPAHDFKPVRSDKLEMILLRPQEIKQSIFERPVSKTALPQMQLRRAENVQIGISWQCALCDLDLYVRAMPGAPVLYFGNIATKHGYYWKDYRNSPQPTNGFETISFDVALDLRTFLIAINFYEGEAPKGVSGEIRISIDDQTYAAPFHIPATHGNGGQDMTKVFETGKTSGHHSVIVDALRIVKAR